METTETESRQLRVGDPSDAPALAQALGEQQLTDQVARWLDEDLCVLAEAGGRPVGLLRLVDESGRAAVHAILVAPGAQRLDVERDLLEGAAQLATDLGSHDLRVKSWSDHPMDRAALRADLLEHGYRADGADLVRTLPIRLEAATTEEMRSLGVALAQILRAGDLILTSGDLGAGKTTLTQGIGAGLGVQGPVISPTFVLVRRHAGTEGRPGLVHVDAYRLGSLAELVDLDLDETMDESVTVVEWGAGIAEELEGSYLEIDIERSGDPADDTRILYIQPVGPRWQGVDLGVLRQAARPADAPDHQGPDTPARSEEAQ
ncbi:tRNA (adenosine(37)-N6)-threonylcarbamoyltransferase complex ATPase subunit type 1 TsaE [Acidipropionibacterium jensenii]|uniref:tRNA (adenosine(37)-N6)-threonylcarbamoyltransferase complex ATPase subunit type 1 TsaE n=1 Tax=Acidipropionibacterium jensenii TaxID=1749 RepID=UPI000BC2C683|nr:tRNA (adenosine(37)-N6)-threonylcarbamoyltransferase complex ATPase subunit type 1 TsaE [Acidipropionibacterium jensenii]